MSDNLLKVLSPCIYSLFHAKGAKRYNYINIKSVPLNQQNYSRNAKLRRFYKILSTNSDGKKEFISTMEGTVSSRTPSQNNWAPHSVLQERDHQWSSDRNHSHFLKLFRTQINAGYCAFSGSTITYCFFTKLNSCWLFGFRWCWELQRRWNRGNDDGNSHGAFILKWESF